MSYKEAYLTIIAVLLVFLVASCAAGTPSPQPQESMDAATLSTSTPLPTQTLEPTLTHTAQPTPTPVPSLTPIPVPSLTPSPVPAQAALSGIVRQLCPALRPPLGLFSIPEPFYDTNTDPATLYVLYQVMELGPDASGESCTFYISPPPMGAPQFAGDSLYWMSFDDEAECVMVWRYDPNDDLTDDVYPQHASLRQTRTNTSIGKVGLFDFVLAKSGETLVWSYTDPQPSDENEMWYSQMMYAGATSGPNDQRPPADVWFDFVPEEDSGASIIRPRKISSDGERVFYSLEPVGLGRQWPEPLGRYTSLYSISTWGDAYPEIHFDCGRDYWCITDFSEEQGILISSQGAAIQIIDLSNGELIREVPAPEAYPLARQAVIGPSGTIAFLSIAMGESDYGDPPEDAAIFLIHPPYQEEPALVMRDAGFLNLLGWASPSQVLADGNDLAEDTPTKSTLPERLMLVDIEIGTGTWLRHDADLFVSLIY